MTPQDRLWLAMAIALGMTGAVLVIAGTLR